MTLPAPVSPGDPIKAADFNAVVREIRALKQIGNQQGRTKTSEHVPPGVIRVRNDYAFRINRYKPAGIDDPVTDIAEDLSAANAFEKQRIFSVTRPQTRHISRFCVLMQPLQPGEIGLAMLSGPIPVYARWPLHKNAATGTGPDDLASDSPPYRESTGGLAVIANWFGSKTGGFDDRHALTDDEWWQEYLRPENGYCETAVYASDTVHARIGDHFAGPSLTAPEILRSTYGIQPIRGVQARTLYCGKTPHSHDGDVATTGGTTFICNQGRWDVLSSTCEDGADSWYYVERENYLAKYGFAPIYGLVYPCAHGSLTTSVPCRREYQEGFFTETVLDKPIAWLEADVKHLGNNTYQVRDCVHRTVCVWDCVNDGGWAWSQTVDCPTPCTCVELDADLYPCNETAEPKHVVLPCRPPTTTTTSGPPPSTTTTSVPPCTGTCTLTCRCDGANAVWLEIQSGCNDNGGEPCQCDTVPPTYIEMIGGCNIYNRGLSWTAGCLQGGSYTTTSTPPGGSGDCPCEGTCEWLCYEYPTYPGVAYTWLEVPSEATCDPAGEFNCGCFTRPSTPCTVSNKDERVNTDCGPPTTTTTTTTTTTSAPPTTTTTSAPPTTTTTTTTTTSAPPTTTTTTTTTSTTTTSSPPTGACCVDGVCTPDYTEVDCTGNGGIYVGDGTGCSPDPCVVTTTTTTTSGAPCTGQCQYVCTNPGGEAYQWQLYNNTCVGTCVTCDVMFADSNCNSGTIDTTTDVSCMPA